MKIVLGLFAILLLVGLPAAAQNKDQHGPAAPAGNQHPSGGNRGGMQHIPAHGPTPTPRGNTANHGAPNQAANRGQEQHPAPNAAPENRAATAKEPSHQIQQTQAAHRNYSDQPGHPNAPHVHANNTWGDTTRDRTIRTTIWTVPGSTGISQAGSGLHTCGICREAVRTGSGSMGSTSRWRRTICSSAGTGTGIAIRS